MCALAAVALRETGVDAGFQRAAVFIVAVGCVVAFRLLRPTDDDDPDNILLLIIGVAGVVVYLVSFSGLIVDESPELAFSDVRREVAKSDREIIFRESADLRGDGDTSLVVLIAGGRAGYEIRVYDRKDGGFKLGYRFAAEQTQRKLDVIGATRLGGVMFDFESAPRDLDSDGYDEFVGSFVALETVESPWGYLFNVANRVPISLAWEPESSSYKMHALFTVPPRLSLRARRAPNGEYVDSFEDHAAGMYNRRLTFENAFSNERVTGLPVGDFAVRKIENEAEYSRTKTIGVIGATYFSENTLRYAEARTWQVRFDEGRPVVRGCGRAAGHRLALADTPLEKVTDDLLDRNRDCRQTN